MRAQGVSVWISGLLVSIFAAGLIVAPLPSEAGERRVALYEARYRNAAELVPLAEVALAPGGSVTLDPHTNAIVLIGPEQDVATALEILRTQDRAPRSILVRQQWIRASELQAARVEIRWSTGSGDIRVGNISPPPSDDVVAMKTWADFRTMHEQRSEELTVAEGASSRIETGTIIPYSTNAGSTLHEGSRAHHDTTWVDLPTGFSTRARILGDGRIHVELSTVHSTPGGQGAVDQASATTVVDLEPGVIRVVGGLQRHHRQTRSDLASGAERGRGEEGLLLLVSAEVISGTQGAPKPP
jgi:type II secretory pathway component GspD/PulD (secretin)